MHISALRQQLQTEEAYQIRKVISSLSTQQTTWIGEPRDELNIRLEQWRICFENNVNESR